MSDPAKPDPAPSDSEARRAALEARLGEPVTLDALTGAWSILQRKRGHRHSTDDVLTAYYALVHGPRTDAALDLGTGIGTVGLLVLHGLGPDATLTCVEAQEISYALLLENLALNGLQARVKPTLGDLRVVRCRDVIAAGPPPANPPPVWRLNKSLNGGGILVNWGCYDLDYLFGITGWTLRPQRVLARTWTNIPDYAAYAAPGSDAETHVAAFVECADGVALTYERGEFMSTQTDEAWQIIGTRGALRMNMKPQQGKQVSFDRPGPHGTVSEVIWQGDEDWDMQHRGPLADFVEAVRERREPATSLHRALLLQELTDAIYASAAGAGCVEMGK